MKFKAALNKQGGVLPGPEVWDGAIEFVAAMLQPQIRVDETIAMATLWLVSDARRLDGHARYYHIPLRYDRAHINVIDRGLMNPTVDRHHLFIKVNTDEHVIDLGGSVLFSGLGSTFRYGIRVGPDVHSLDDVMGTHPYRLPLVDEFLDHSSVEFFPAVT